MAHLDSEQVEIPCPKCGKKIKKTIRWFKSRSVTCPHCRTDIDTKDFRASVEKVERQIDDLFRKFGDLKIKL